MLDSFDAPSHWIHASFTSTWLFSPQLLTPVPSLGLLSLAKWKLVKHVGWQPTREDMTNGSHGRDGDEVRMAGMAFTPRCDYNDDGIVVVVVSRIASWERVFQNEALAYSPDDRRGVYLQHSSSSLHQFPSRQQQAAERTVLGFNAVAQVGSSIYTYLLTLLAVLLEWAWLETALRFWGFV